MTNRTRPIPAPAGIAILIASLLALGGCKGEARGDAAGKTAAGQGPAPVLVAPVTRKDVPVEIRSFGRVEAYSTIDVKSQAAGELTEVLFREGDEVKRGQHLFTIDPRPYEATLHQAEGALARDRAQLMNAELEVKRNRDLVEKEYVSRDVFDQVVAAAEALAGSVRADEAAVQNATIQVGYCRIASPVDGRIGKLMVHRGNIVKANADTQLVTITQIRPIYVPFSVPEKELAEIRKRQAEGKLAVEATPAGSTGPAAGELTFINNTVDPATGMILLRATFDNADGALWPGLFVTVRLRVSTLAGALVVPSQAIQVGQQGAFVFVVKDDSTVDLRPVAVRITSGPDSVIERGIQDGETVVTLGQIRLFPGAKVEKKEPQAAAAPDRPAEKAADRSAPAQRAENAEKAEKVVRQ